MRKISVSNCKPGMTLGKAIFYNGTTSLLEAGAKLTSNYIRKLSNLGISEIYIHDDLSQNIKINDVVQESTRLEAKEYIKNIMESYSYIDIPNFDEVMALVDKIITEIISLNDIIVNIMDIKTYDDYTFSHSVNVCILSIIIGFKLGLDMNQLQELGIGAILHDIGKVMVPPSILQKKCALTDEEYETMKRHSLLGYEILKKMPSISEESAKVALCHHERCDGKGYPNSLSKDEINLYSRIVAISDIYDALSSDRIYRKKISTNQAIDYLVVSSSSSIDKNILDCFLKIIPPYPIGTVVLLNNGEKGIVSRSNCNLPTRPKVKVIFNADGTKKLIYRELDLAHKRDYYIVSTSEITG